MGKEKSELKEIKLEPQNSISDKTKDELIAQLKADNAALNKKIAYAPQPAKMPENQMGLPVGMRESQVKTTVRDISSIISEKMQQLKDMATMEILMDTGVRMKNRLESIKKISSAEHLKIRGHWKTIAPQIYVSGLTGKKINNDEMEISFGVYDVDDKGNKKLFVHYADVLMHDGSQIRRPTSAEYRIAYEVTERIKTGKGITREVVKLERREE